MLNFPFEFLQTTFESNLSLSALKKNSLLCDIVKCVEVDF